MTATQGSVVFDKDCECSAEVDRLMRLVTFRGWHARWLPWSVQGCEGVPPDHGQLQVREVKRTRGEDGVVIESLTEWRPIHVRESRERWPDPEPIQAPARPKMSRMEQLEARIARLEVLETRRGGGPVWPEAL
jgi:hypothetical protein